MKAQHHTHSNRDNDVLIERRRHPRPFPPMDVKELDEDLAWQQWEEAVLVQETAMAVNALLASLVKEFESAGASSLAFGHPNPGLKPGAAL